MPIIVFDVAGDFAFFRNPEGTRTNYSFPFPPRTAIIGMIAAILGKQRNKYWNEPEFKKMKIGVQLLKYPETFPIKVNYWQTKHDQIIKIKDTDKKTVAFLMPKDPEGFRGRGYRTQIKLEYLKDVRYRIFVLTNNDELQKELTFRLKKNKYYYPPFLGHNNLLATIKFIGSFEYENITDGNYETIIPVETIDETKTQFNQLTSIKVFYSVPNAYKAEQVTVNELQLWSSIPLEYTKIIIPVIYEKERYKNIQIHPSELKLVLKPGYGYRVRVNDETVDVCLFSTFRNKGG